MRSIENGQILASSNVGGAQTTITSLAFSQNDETCYSSTSDGKIYIWDLQPALSIFMPVKMITNQQFEILQQKIKTSTSKNETKWIEMVVALSQWHRRFDIHIIENPVLSIGEFDIYH